MMKQYIVALIVCILIPLRLLAQPKVAIRELLYDTPLSETGGGERYDGEFVSIQNYGKEEVNISGWKLTSDGEGQVFVFPVGSVMPPSAIFIVAHRSYHSNFNLSDLYITDGLQSSDRVFYQSAIIHANTGENVNLYRADGELQDHLYYDGTSNLSKSSRLEASNTGKPCEANTLTSIQRHTVTTISNQIVFSPLDYRVATVTLSENSFDRYMRDDNNLFNTNTNIGVFDVNATGAATYTIPINCPTGVQGIQPSVALVYNSQGRNGIAGWGWNIAGISAITRTGSTIFYDYKVVGVELTTADNLILDGQRLTLVSGSHFAAGTKYRTEVESFSDITYKKINGYMCFEVKTKDGKTLQYGASANSYIEAQGTSTALTWLLTRVEDANGNYMTYTYGEDNYNGEFWLEKIAYTGNAGTAPANEISFGYEGRDDVETYYVAGKKTMLSKRLNAITVKSNNQPFHKYVLEYEFDEFCSKISAIKEFTADEVAYTPLVVTWGNEYDDFSKCGSEDWAYLSENLESRPVFADFDGDGKRDFITIKDRKVKLYLNHNMYSTQFFKQCEFIVYGDDYKNIFVADLNGDGLMDLVSVTKAPNGTYRYNYHFFNGKEFDSGGATGYYGFNEEVRDDNYIVGDFNGDGRHEILIRNSQKVYNQYGSQIALGGITNWGSALVPSFPNNMNLLDFSGNGKTNICTRNATHGFVYELDGNTFKQVFTTPDLSNYYDVYPGDFNGDGKMDLYVITNKANSQNEYENYFLISTGSSFLKKSLPRLYEDPRTLKGFTGDFNLDGKTDFMVVEYYYDSESRENRMQFKTGLNKGGEFEFQPVVRSTYQVVNRDDWRYLDVADYDGDGRSEINYNRSNAWLWYIRSIDDTFISQVSTISNDLNENINLTYLSVSSRGIYSASDNHSVSFPLVKTLFPLYVVNIAYHNGQNLGYYYRNIRTHKQGKGFLGFGEICATNYTTRIKTTTEYGDASYFYDFLPMKQTVATTQDAMISTTTYEYNSRYLGNNFRRHPYVLKNVVTDHLKGLSTTTEVLSMDTYGNPTSARKTCGDVTETVTTEYVANGSWCLSKPERVTTTRKLGAETHTRKALYEYDAKGNVTKEIKDPEDVNKLVTEYKDFDKFGHAQRVEVTANGSTLVSTLAYTPSGRFIAVQKNAMGEANSYKWDERRGLLLSETNALGLTTSHVYDKFGRWRETAYPDGSRKNQELKWVADGDDVPTYNARYYAYSHASDGAGGYTWFDGLGREVCSQTFDFNNKRIGIFTAYTYEGRKYSVSKPKFDPEAQEKAEVYTYDRYGRLEQVVTPRGNIRYAYNGKVTTVTGPEGTTETTVNGAGQVVTSKVNGQAVHYTYYASGLTKTSMPEGGQAITMRYDLQGNKVELIDPNAGKITYSSNGFGQLVARMDARGNKDSMRYDKQGRVIRKITPEATYTYTYNKYGLGSVMRNDTIEYLYSYDSYGRTTAEHIYVDSSKYSFAYTYNSMGQPKTKTYPNSFTLEYGYANGSHTAIAGGGSTLWQLQDANALGQPLRYSWGSGQHTTLEYDAHNLLKSKAGSGQLPKQEYSFDAAMGNLISRNLGAVTENFMYDGQHRLTQWSDKSIAYAANGNMSYKSDVGLYDYGPLHPHAVSNVTNLDEDMDEMQLVPLRMNYDSKNRPLFIAQGDDSLTFYYDHSGQRLYARHYKAGVLYKTTHYAGGFEKDIYADSTRTRSFIYAPTGLLAVYETSTAGCHCGLAPQPTASGCLLYAHTDHLGSIVAIANAQGALLYEYSYDPWGNLRNPQTLELYTSANMPALHLGRGFTGHEHLPLFGLINMNARLYDPVLGRMLSPDPYVVDAGYTQDFNRYSYARNNPLSYVDPSGESFWSIFRAFTVDLIKTIFTGGLDLTSSSARDDAWKNFDPTAPWSKTNHAWKIEIGQYITNPKLNFGERQVQLLSRRTLEAPQSIIGREYSQWRNLFGGVDRVDYFDGATFVTNENASHNDGVSLGNYINTNIDHEIRSDFEKYVLTHPLYMHEYGHTIDSRIYGLSYLLVIGVPSVLSAANSGQMEDEPQGVTTHDFRWYEMRANKHAAKYFEKYYGVNWLSPYRWHTIETFYPRNGR